MIRGEKIFTAKIRAKCLAACERVAKKREREAAFFRNLSQRIASAKSNEDLERVRLGLSLDVKRATGIDLLPYVHDTRKQCHFCKKKVHGGCSGSVLTKREIFACWNKSCQKKYDRTIAKDKRANPKLYAEAERKARERKRIRFHRGRVISSTRVKRRKKK